MDHEKKIETAQNGGKDMMIVFQSEYDALPVRPPLTAALISE